MDAHRFWVAAGLPAVSWVKAGGELGRDVPRCLTESTPSLLGCLDRGWLGGHTAHRVTKAFLLIPAPTLPTPEQAPAQTGL